MELYPITVDSRYLDFGYLEQPLFSKRKSGPCLNLASGNKILSIRGEIAQSLITHSFVKFGCAISIFLNPENLICRTTDISVSEGPFNFEITRVAVL